MHQVADKAWSWGCWRARGPAGHRVVMKGHHLPKLTGRRALLSLAKNAADLRKIKRADGAGAAYKNLQLIGIRTVSGWRTRSGWGRTAAKRPSQKLGLVWEGSHRGCGIILSAPGKPLRAQKEKALNQQLSPDTAQIFLFKELCDPGSRLKSDLYNTKEIPESRMPLRSSSVFSIALQKIPV